MLSSTVVPAAAVGDQQVRTTDTASRVVVVTSPDGAASAGQAALAAGGAVLSELPLIGGVEALLPEGASLPAGLVVAENRPMTLTTSEAPADAPVSSVRETLGLAPDGNEGVGVTVALVDTGVADVPDLAGQVVAHVDVTGTGGGDGFGHGTFMAGLIAGTGVESGGAYRGVAPGAKIFDVKVARQDGSTDLVSVLKGLQTVADEGRRHGVKVLNLSLSSNSPMPYQVDPLNQGLRSLWRRGITVVVSGGNTGPGPGTITSPGNDPTFVTVGGLDEQGTGERSDDVIGSWSSRGSSSDLVAKPDLVAPGQSVVSLRAPGSVIDTKNPTARVSDDYFRGSGTSMSAAVVSGAAAAAMSVRPQLRPDAVKGLLTATTYDAAGLGDRLAAGSGGLDVSAALQGARSGATTAWTSQEVAIPGDAKTWQSLNDAFDRDDRAAAAKAWAKLSPEARSWAEQAWSGTDAESRDWAGRSWLSRSWAGADGTTDEWLMRYWAGRSWLGRSWLGDDWSGRSWLGDDWSGRSWLGRSWLSDDWETGQWAGATWSSNAWSGRWD